jgi:hypothetical protein
MTARVCVSNIQVLGALALLQLVAMCACGVYSSNFAESFHTTFNNFTTDATSGFT